MASPFTWAQQLGMSVPVICAPMGGAAGGRLAESVSRAGALGMIGLGSSATATSLSTELQQLSPGFRRFGIGLVDWVVQRDPQLLDHVLEASPALVSVSFGDLSAAAIPWISRAHEAGAVTAAQIASADEAQFAEDAGVDLIVARGKEAGGHGQPAAPLFPLLEHTVHRVSVPVLAAGGISTGADLARAVQAGASGAWVGTAFAVCHESLMSHRAKERIVRASADETVVSRVMDIALGYPWPPHLPERLITTTFEQAWRGREEELRRDAEALRTFRDAAARGDHTVVPVNAGTGVDRITERRPASDVVAAFATGLEEHSPAT